MPASLNQFVTHLYQDSSVASLKAAFLNIADDYHIGRVEVSDGETISVIFEGESYSRTNVISVDSDGICMTLFKDLSDKVWNMGETRTVLEVALTFYKNHHFHSKLNDAPYTQFLTGLPNAFGLNKIISEQYTKEELVGRYSLLAFNIKGFSLINKYHSSEFGDLAIQLAAKEYGKLINKEDRELLVHHGSDSFLALIKNFHVYDFIKSINPILINIKAKPEDPDCFHSLFTTVGVVPIDTTFERFADYITDALIAVSHGKANREPIVYLNAHLKQEIELSKSIELTIDEELKQGTIVIYYQPKVDVDTGFIVGTEALARWNKNGTIVSPNIFIPVLEKSGNIHKLDLYILEKACSDLSHYRELGHHTVPVSVNISRRDLLVPGFYRDISKIIRKYNLRFEDVVIEVTETGNMEEKIRMQEFVSYLKEHNIKTSLDDFGMGYSSLSTLRDFEVNEIKIDQSFINRQTFTEKDAIILSTIARLAFKLGIDVVFEGVETYEQLSLLKSLGAKTVQGFYFDQPLPKDEFESRLAIGRYNVKL